MKTLPHLVSLGLGCILLTGCATASASLATNTEENVSQETCTPPIKAENFSGALIKYRILRVTIDLERETYRVYQHDGLVHVLNPGATAEYSSPQPFIKESMYLVDASTRFGGRLKNAQFPIKGISGCKDNIELPIRFGITKEREESKYEI